MQSLKNDELKCIGYRGIEYCCKYKMDDSVLMKIFCFINYTASNI